MLLLPEVFVAPPMIGDLDGSNKASLCVENVCDGGIKNSIANTRGTTTGNVSCSA